MSETTSTTCDEMGILAGRTSCLAAVCIRVTRPFDNVRQEAIDNVRRLRNHPSIVFGLATTMESAGFAGAGRINIHQSFGIT